MRETMIRIFDMSSKLTSDRIKVPLDVKCVGYLEYIFSVLFILAGIQYARWPDAEFVPRETILFGAVTLDNGYAAGIYYAVCGVIGLLIGYALLRLQPIGWWLLILGGTYGIVSLIGKMGLVLELVYPSLYIVWAVCRTRIFDPLSLFRSDGKRDSGPVETP
jgi:hypothetical protein